MSNTTDNGCKNSLPQRIAKALIASGYTTLDAQAMTLGLRRSTAWHIIKSKQKIGRLSQKVRQKMLANPNLPPLVRKQLEQPEAGSWIKVGNLKSPGYLRISDGTPPENACQSEPVAADGIPRVAHFNLPMSIC